MLEIFQRTACYTALSSGGVTATKSLRLGAVLAMSKSVETSRDFGGQLEGPDPDPLLYGRTRTATWLFCATPLNSSIKSGSEQEPTKSQTRSTVT